MSDDNPYEDPSPVVATLAELFAAEGKAREVAILASAEKITIDATDYDNWNGGTWYHTLNISIPVPLYTQLGDERPAIERGIADKVREVTSDYESSPVASVSIKPRPVADASKWRERARAWLAGEGVTNQGRVRSDNVAPREVDGLLFRSEPEVNLYRALKALGATFAPLPVFLRGGEDYRRLEPDFVILSRGIVLHVEVDGDTTHHETPVEAQQRAAVLTDEGAVLERVRAAECETPQAAAACAERLLAKVGKIKSNR